MTTPTVTVTPEILAAKARQARPQREASFEDITPDIARDMLLTNTLNRPKKSQAIRRYVDDINRGEWEVTNQGIGFDKAGTLSDGQNRLYAVIETGRVIHTLVIRGLDESARLKVDRHTRRTLADSLLIMGTDHQLGNRICEAARASLMATLKSNVPDSLIHKYIVEHLDSLQWVGEVFRHRIRGISRAPVLAICAQYYERCPDKEKPQSFVRCLLDPTSAEERSTVHLLREWLLSNAHSFNAETAAILLGRATRYAAIHHWLGTVITEIDSGPATDALAWPQSEQ